MNSIKLNETPVRTARNFKINNIAINEEFPDIINEFNNVIIENESSKVNVIQSELSEYKLTYGLNDVLEKEVKEKANQNIKIIIDSKVNKEVKINFKFDEENLELVESLEIIANEDSKATVILKYEACEGLEAYHNGIIRLNAKNNSNINVIVINLLNQKTNNFMSIENNISENSKVKYTMIELGGKNTITNLYSNLKGIYSENLINSIYLGKDNQVFDLNYIGELRGEKSNLNIEVQGALKDFARKHFKGTIDFKKGCKRATGNENESCMLLSDKARSLALPMLLCSEEDVEGNHSTSSGKIADNELFYIMTRGFEKKEAIKLMVRAKFNSILNDIKNEELRNEILQEIDKRLD